MNEAIFSLITATVLLLGSPGPATLGLAGVAAAFGFRGGLHFLGGILAGLVIVIVGATVGLAALFSAFPGARLAVQIVGILYIVYIAIKIATAPHESDSVSAVRQKPTFVDGFVLNLLNPKAYAAFLALFSQFLLPISSSIGAFLATAAICFAVGVVVDVIWLSFGAIIRPLFRQPRRARIVRVVFAVLMVAAVFWALTQQA